MVSSTNWKCYKAGILKSKRLYPQLLSKKCHIQHDTMYQHVQIITPTVHGRHSQSFQCHLSQQQCSWWRAEYPTVIITAKAIRMVKINPYTRDVGFGSRPQLTSLAFSCVHCMPIEYPDFYSKQLPTHTILTSYYNIHLIGKGGHWKFYSHPLSKCI